MLVTKRKKTVEVFDINKVRTSIKKTFNVTNRPLSEEEIDLITSKLKLQDGMRTNEIQTQLEDILMELGYKNEARYFIIHRHINYHSKSMSDKVRFMREYLSASNPATGSKFDPNANVTCTNITTLSGELFKGEIIKLNRYRMHNAIEKKYGKELADYYVWLLENHYLYKHDESSLNPYCVSITMYPWLNDGLRSLGGLSTPPKNLDSFCGSFINLMFAISSQFAGAIASGEFLMYFDYFARKEFGQNYRKYSMQFYTIGPKLRELINISEKPFNQFFDLDSLKNCDFENEKANSLRDSFVEDANRLATERELSDWYNSCLDENGNFTWSPLKLGDGTRTIQGQIEQYFQQIVYSMNQPAAARSYQSVFWNISYFDKYYFDGMFHDFRFPDGTAPVWDSLWWLQKKFMKWFNQERTKEVITFPVESFSLLTDGTDLKDEEAANFVAEMYSEGHSFFTYMSDNPDALSSCCRLRNEVTDNQFSYSLGAGGVMTGSKSVMTINLNRVIQTAIKNDKNYIEEIRTLVQKVQKFQDCYNDLVWELMDQKALPVYESGFITLDKQYLTLGVNGFVEAAEFLGIEAKPTQEYKEFCESILKVFYEENKKAKTKHLMFNTEFVPAENLGVKNYNWDKKDGFKVPINRNCYNSYFYAVEDTKISILDKFKLHGKDYVKYLDGGSALHCNLDSHLSKAQYRQLLRVAAQEGTNYFTFNIPNTICNDCGHIDKRYLKACPKCGSNNIDYATRVIGYLKRISNFSEPRQDEAERRFYAKESDMGTDA